MKKLGFTLAETLVCIGLLSLIVVLFMPTIRNEQNKDQFYTAQYVKVFNDIFTVSQSLLVVDFRSLHDYSGMSATDVRNSFANHFDVTSTWTANQVNTWPNTIDGALVSITRANTNDIIGMTLNNGVQLGFWIADAADIATTVTDLRNNPNLSNVPADNLMGVLFVDINGRANPNKLNQDQYVIPFYADGIRNNISYKD